MTTRWMAGVARRLAPPPTGSDADLLARFAEARDPGAFAALVARHGAAVYGVCRARLANAADADDAFQVVFYVLARDARRIRDRESVAGWLMRVAQLTALKVRRDHARHPAAQLPAELAERRADDGAAREERAIVAEELAALPDKFRAVLVLCAVEGRSNTEAAEALGCPRGTVDSRLAAAKAKLRQRLLRRGVGLTALAALPQLAADAGGWPSLADGSWLTAIQYGTGASPPTALTTLADGVSTAMTTTTKLVATALLAGGLLATTGFGLTQGGGDGPRAAAATPPAKADKPVPPTKPDAPQPVAQVSTEVEARGRLAKSLKQAVPEIMTLRELIKLLRDEYGLIVRVDLAAYRRSTFADFDPEVLYDRKLKFPMTNGMTVADLLNDAVAELWAGYRVRDGHVLIAPAYVPRGAGFEAAEPHARQQEIVEQIAGEPVSIALEEKSFKDAVKELRRLTGANIVVNANAPNLAGVEKLVVTATFDGVRLYTVLEVLGDMVGLKVVFLSNVYYLTSPESAAKLQKKASEEVYGRDPILLPVPAGYLTDGVRFYSKLPNLTPIDPPASRALPPEPAAGK